MQKQNLCQGGFMPKNRQHYRKIKYPDKVTKQKRLVFVRIFLFCSAGSKITYFPTVPNTYFTDSRYSIAFDSSCSIAISTARLADASKSVLSFRN